MWAVAPVVDMGSDFHKLRLQVAIEEVNVFFCVVTSGDPCLIGHHKGKIAQIIHQFYRLAGPTNPLQLVWAMGIANVGIEDAIAIEKHGAAACHCRNKSL